MNTPELLRGDYNQVKFDRIFVRRRVNRAPDEQIEQLHAMPPDGSRSTLRFPISICDRRL